MGIFFKSTKKIPRSVTRIRQALVVIFILAFLAGILDYPKAWDKAADWLNPKLDKLPAVGNLDIPYFKSIPYRLGLDLQGGIHLIYATDLSGIGNEERGEAIEGVRDVIERRVNLYGVAEPLVQINKSQEEYRLIVELAGIKNISQAVAMIGETPFLEFKEELPNDKGNEIIKRSLRSLPGGEEESGFVTADVLCSNQEGLKIFLLQFGQDPCFVPTGLSGSHLKGAQAAFNQNTSQPYVSLEFNDEGKDLFRDITSLNVGKKIAIYLDGAPISIPTVQEAITGGSAQITGSFTLDEVKQLVRRLNAGALPVPISLISQQSIEASLGNISLAKSLKAGVLGFFAVILFLLIFYRARGFIAALALFLYIAFALSLFKLIPVTLTLAGVAGLILSVGMAVDANVLIFERIKEELKSGKSRAYATDEGFKRAWPSIRDGNFSTLITCFVLYIFTTGPVKGFALTLGLGVLLSMITAVVITRFLLKFKNSA